MSLVGSQWAHTEALTKTVALINLLAKEEKVQFGLCCLGEGNVTHVHPEEQLDPNMYVGTK